MNCLKKGFPFLRDVIKRMGPGFLREGVGVGGGGGKRK